MLGKLFAPLDAPQGERDREPAKRPGEQCDPCGPAIQNASIATKRGHWVEFDGRVLNKISDRAEPARHTAIDPGAAGDFWQVDDVVAQLGAIRRGWRAANATSIEYGVE